MALWPEEETFRKECHLSSNSPAICLMDKGIDLEYIFSCTNVNVKNIIEFFLSLFQRPLRTMPAFLKVGFNYSLWQV